MAYDIVFEIASENDVGNSMMSMFLRTEPFASKINLETEEKNFFTSYMKERVAMTGEDRPMVFDFSCIFREGCLNYAIHPTIPPCYAIALEVRKALITWKQRLAKKILYPRYSRKTVSKEAARSIGVARATGLDMERNYHKYGTYGSGRAEMRQTWGFNDLSPRTYITPGAIICEVSPYSQDIFNALVDSLEISHRRHRFDLGRLVFDKYDDVWVYDYAAFTSNMTEQKYFLDQLADFCDDTEITVFDSWIGVTTRNLGEYIRRYNTVANKKPSFVLGDVLLRRLGIEPGAFIQEKAGFLGVFGNLATCTFLHGIVSAFITRRFDRSSVVGDDGLQIHLREVPRSLEEGEVKEMMVDANQIKAALRLLGDISEIKFAVLTVPQVDNGRTDQSWTYLKRALERFEDTLFLGYQEHMVNLIHCFPTSIETHRITTEERADRYRKIANQVLTILLRLWKEPSSNLEERAILGFLRIVYSRIGFPVEGAYPGTPVGREVVDGAGQRAKPLVSHYIVPPVPLPEFAHYLRIHPIINLGRFLGVQTLKVPRLESYRNFPKASLVNVPFSSFCAVGAKILTLSEDFGYVIREDVMEEVDFADEEDYLSWFHKMKSKEFSVLYRYTIIRKLPRFFVDMYHP